MQMQLIIWDYPQITLGFEHSRQLKGGTDDEERLLSLLLYWHQFKGQVEKEVLKT